MGEKLSFFKRIDLIFRNLFKLPSKDGKRRFIKNWKTGKMMWTQGEESKFENRIEVPIVRDIIPTEKKIEIAPAAPIIHENHIIEVIKPSNGVDKSIETKIIKTVKKKATKPKKQIKIPVFKPKKSIKKVVKGLRKTKPKKKQSKKKK